MKTFFTCLAILACVALAFFFGFDMGKRRGQEITKKIAVESFQEVLPKIIDDSFSAGVETADKQWSKALGVEYNR